MTPPGDHYVFLLTDTNEILQEIIIDTVYNFEGTGVEEQRVYGLSYAGELEALKGKLYFPGSAKQADKFSSTIKAILQYLQCT